MNEKPWPRWKSLQFDVEIAESNDLSQGWGNRSTGERRAWGPEFDSQNTQVRRTSKKLVMVTALILALGRKTQTDAWGFLASQTSLLGKFQAGERPCLKPTMTTKDPRRQQ